MFPDFSRCFGVILARIRHPFPRAALLCSLPLALLGGVLPAQAQCVTTGLIGDASGDDTPGGEGESVVDVSAEGEHLVVEVETAAAFEGSVVFLDGEGVALASETFHSDGQGFHQVTLPEALLEFPARGFQYSVRLSSVDDDGVEQVAHELPLRLALDCEGAACAVRAIPGLSSAPAAVSEDLVALWEEAQAASPDDVLGFIEGQRPDLVGEVYELSASWTADPAAGSAKTPQSPCACRWVTVGGYTESSDQQVFDYAPGPSTEAVSRWHQGVRGYIAGQTTDGLIDKPIEMRFAALGMHLVCSRLEGTIPREIVIEDRLATVTIPVLSACSASCDDAKVVHSGSSSVCTEARLFSGAFVEATADITLSSHLELGNVGIPLAHAALSFTSGWSMTSRERSGLENFHEEVPGTSSVAALVLDGHFKLGAKRDKGGQSGSYGFGAAESSFYLSAVGVSECAEKNGVAQYSGPSSGGGEVLVRWGDPPS